jgi:hypothetical protein
MRSTTAHLWQRDAMPREVLAQRRELHSSGALEDLDPHSLVCPEPHRRLPQPHGLPLRGSVINSARGGGGGGRRVEEGEQQRLELARHLVLDRRAERVPVAHRVLVPQRRRLRRVAEADDLDEDILVGAPRVLARLEQLPRALGREWRSGLRSSRRHERRPPQPVQQQRLQRPLERAAHELRQALPASLRLARACRRAELRLRRLCEDTHEGLLAHAQPASRRPQLARCLRRGHVVHGRALGLVRVREHRTNQGRHVTLSQPLGHRDGERARVLVLEAALHLSELLV